MTCAFVCYSAAKSIKKKKRKTHNIIANTTLNDPFCLKVFLYFSLHSTFLLSLLPVRHMHQISNKAYNIKIIQQYS